MLHAENATPGNFLIAPERRQRTTQEQTVRDIPEIKLALLTEQELAERWRMSIRTLQGWRYRKTGPKFIKIRGQAVRYPMDDVLVYEAQWQKAYATKPPYEGSRLATTGHVNNSALTRARHLHYRG